MDPAPSPQENRILAAFDPAGLARLARHLEPFPLKAGQVVHAEGDPVDWMVFPTSGLLSHVVQLADGRSVEATSSGPEGMSGLPAFFGASRSPVQTVVQIPGRALRLRPARLLRESVTGSRIRTVLERYGNAVLGMTAQSVGCIRFHHIVERCARWLLVAHDSVSGRAEFALTHEFLAAVLGVRRAGVTEAAGDLVRSGLVRSDRGRFTILNRPGLEGASCECYRVVRHEMESVYRASERAAPPASATGV